MPTFDRARAPYNFVPASKTVVLTDEDEAWRITHDVPFSDGICGALTLRIHAETPLFIRGSNDKERFFTLPDGRRAVPGSSLKGMIRNVLEIAAFGKFDRVNDRTFGVRDLQNPFLYRDHFTDIFDGQPSPSVGAGWLHKRPDDAYDDLEKGEDGSQAWEIRPCHFAKVDYDDLIELAQTRGIMEYSPGKKQSAVDKYKLWDSVANSRDASGTIRVIARDGSTGKTYTRRGDYGLVERGSLTVGSAGGTRGTLVFTGQPSEWNGHQRGRGSPKHNDFFFHGSAGGPIRVPYRVHTAFAQVHATDAEKHSMDDNPNAEWAYWKERFDRETKSGGSEPVPVFFLLNDSGALRAFGLAMMFRLAYDYSVRELIRNSQPEASSSRLDLAEQIFGRVGAGTEPAASLRGRASFETAPEVEVDGRTAQEVDAVTGVLGSPKASYYPSYLEQAPSTGEYGGQPPRDHGGRPLYKSYMNGDARLRGWKRYPRQLSVVQFPPLPKNKAGEENTKVGTTFRPLAAGAEFEGRLVVHNLRPFELGALLWCLDFGELPECWHALGLAKAFGFGSVRISIESAALQDVAGNPIDFSAARKAFADFMESKIPGWEFSDQVLELVAMATPCEEAKAPDLRHMTLEHPEFGNEFDKVKKEGLALPSFVDRSSIAELRATMRARQAEAEEARRLALMSPVDLLVAELEQAKEEQRHLELLESWRSQSGEQESIRKEATQHVMGRPSKQWRKAHLALWEWFRPDQT